MTTTFEAIDQDELSTITGGGALAKATRVAEGAGVIADLYNDGKEIYNYWGRVFHRWGKHM